MGRRGRRWEGAAPLRQHSVAPPPVARRRSSGLHTCSPRLRASRPLVVPQRSLGRGHRRALRASLRSACRPCTTSSGASVVRGVDRPCSFFSPCVALHHAAAVRGSSAPSLTRVPVAFPSASPGRILLPTPSHRLPAASRAFPTLPVAFPSPSRCLPVACPPPSRRLPYPSLAFPRLRVAFPTLPSVFPSLSQPFPFAFPRLPAPSRRRPVACPSPSRRLPVVFPAPSFGRREGAGRRGKAARRRLWRWG